MNDGRSNAVLTTLRNQLAQSKNQTAQYKNLYRRERQENRVVVNLNNQLQRQNNQLQQEIDNLHDQLQDLENHVNSFRFPKVYKKYHELKSPVGRAQRRSQFKRCIEQSLIHIQEVKHATVKLRIGSKDVELFWSENELKNLRWIGQNIVGEGPGNDSTSDEESDIENDKQFDSGLDNNETDPFLSNGKWNPTHVKKIVHVLDLFHISLEAYHELRLSIYKCITTFVCFTNS